jgi:hypothetical protein
MNRYLLDDIIGYARSRRGRENVALVLIAAGSVAGIVATRRV